MTDFTATPVRVAIHGASGRMGQSLISSAAEVPRIDLVAAICRAPDQQSWPAGVRGVSSTALDGLPALDAVVDFSLPAGLDALLEYLRDRPCALVSGTTGLSDPQWQRLRALSAHVPVLWGANFSRGVAVLAELVEQAARALPGWQADLVESHHRHKRDAPSGTALRLRDAAEAGGAVVGEVAALRCGDIVGEHLVQFTADGERIELWHRATDRRVFARGALQCAAWLARQPAGFYTVRDWALTSG